MNESCYNELLVENNIFLEYGEINKEFRKKFEECINRDLLNKKRKSLDFCKKDITIINRINQNKSVLLKTPSLNYTVVFHPIVRQ